jgi:TolB-like protein
MRWLFVIARDSSFAYKGRTADVKQIGRELGVRYVVEGGVRRRRSQVAYHAAQLIDASDGRASVGRSLRGSDLEDTLRSAGSGDGDVVGAIAPKLEQAESDAPSASQTDNLDRLRLKFTCARM